MYNRLNLLCVQVSLDREHWVTVVDRSEHLCRSWQELFFEPKVVRSAGGGHWGRRRVRMSILSPDRYIRVVGVYNSMNRSFHLVSFACLHTSKPFELTDTGFIGKSQLTSIFPKMSVFTCPFFLSSLLFFLVHLPPSSPLLTSLPQPPPLPPFCPPSFLSTSPSLLPFL